MGFFSPASAPKKTNTRKQNRTTAVSKRSAEELAAAHVTHAANNKKEAPAAATMAQAAAADPMAQAALDEALYGAARDGQAFRCLELLEARANVQTLPLVVAVMMKHDDAALALIDAKANVTGAMDGLSDLTLETLLQYATACNASVRLCRKLLSLGADANAVHPSLYGCSPLLNAASHSSGAVCVLLLNAKADVDATDAQSKTALQRAQTHGKSECVDAISGWLKNRAAAHAFARGMRHARNTYQKGCWTSHRLFDVHLIAEITAFVTPRPSAK
jgi:ankyrin repeat protein